MARITTLREQAGFQTVTFFAVVIFSMNTVVAFEAPVVVEVRRFKAERREPVELAIQKEGSLVASVDGTNTLFFDRIDGSGGFSASVKGYFFSVDFSPDGKRCAVGTSDGTLLLFDVAKRQVAAEFEGHRMSVSAVKFTPDGNQIVSTSVDGSLVVWTIKEASHRKLSPRNDNAIICLDVSHDGSRAVTGNSNGEVTIWDMKSGRILLVLRGHKRRVTAVEFSPNSRIVISGGEDSTVRRWAISEGASISVSSVHSEQINAIAYHPAGDCVAVSSGYWGGSNTEIKLWNTPIRTVLWSQSADTRCIIFSDDGKYMLFGESDGTIRLWSIRNPETANRDVPATSIRRNEVKRISQTN